MVSLLYLIVYIEAAKLCKQSAAAAAVCLHNFAEPAGKSPSKHFQSLQVLEMRNIYQQRFSKYIYKLYFPTFVCLYF